MIGRMRRRVRDFLLKLRAWWGHEQSLAEQRRRKEEGDPVYRLHKSMTYWHR